MKLATLCDGTRDGRLVVVSRDLTRASPAPAGHNRGRKTKACRPSVTSEIAMMAAIRARSVERRIGCDTL